MSVSEFNSSLLPKLGELLEANAQVNVSPVAICKEKVFDKSQLGELVKKNKK